MFALLPLNLPALVRIPLALLCGMIFGGLYAGLVGFMKVKFGSNEVIATMMLNTIAVNFVEYAVNYPQRRARASPRPQNLQRPYGFRKLWIRPS